MFPHQICGCCSNMKISHYHHSHYGSSPRLWLVSLVADQQRYLPAMDIWAPVDMWYLPAPNMGSQESAAKDTASGKARTYDKPPVKSESQPIATLKRHGQTFIGRQNAHMNACIKKLNSFLFMKKSYCWGRNIMDQLPQLRIPKQIVLLNDM